MSQDKVFAGAALRRLRLSRKLTQIAMAEALGISASYLNLLERNQRPLTARLMLALSERFDFDPRLLLADEPGGGVEAMMRRFNDPQFADLAIDRQRLAEWAVNAPELMQAFARLHDSRAVSGNADDAGDNSHPAIALVRREIEKWRNYYGDLDVAAEEMADELRLANSDLYAALSDRLRSRHQIMVRVLPVEVLPDHLYRLDMHARQLQLSEMLDTSSRTFRAAYMIAQLEMRDAVQALAAGAAFDNRGAERLFQRHLYGYIAAAIIMPYGRFLRACEQTGYDIAILQRRFGAGLEEIAHRLTTLQRVGQRGLPFFMVRVDRAGQFSKRYSGASGASFVESGRSCPLWHLHHSFARPSILQVQLVESEDGKQWLTLSRTVNGNSSPARGNTPDMNGEEPAYAIGIGIAAEHASRLCAHYARVAEASGPTLIGPGCHGCHRPDCTQRATPPAGKTLLFDDRARRAAPFIFHSE
ncbi:MAG: short-chain fatty acyl-CoA regulator family protein [Pseudomonadota bacterium]